MFSALVIGLYASLFSQPAKAAVDPQVVDLAVKAFVAGGAAFGIPITPDEVEIVTPLVQCIADNSSIPACGKKILISKLPQQAQDFVTCVTDRRDPALCAQDQAFKQLPPSARQLAECIARQTDAVECGKRFATTEAEKAAADVIDRLRTRVTNPAGQVITPIENIVRVVDAIARENWDVVALEGGKAVAKYVIRTVLTSLLTQAGSALIGPVVDGLVENRVDLAIDLINALKSQDPGRIARATVQAYLYLSLPVVQACALFPSGAVKEAVCGFVADVLGDIADVGGKVVDTGAKEAEKRYNDLQDVLTGNKDNCGAGEQYYDANFAFCKYQAEITQRVNPDGFAEMERSLYEGCRAHFEPCSKRIQITIPSPFGDINIGSKSTEDVVNRTCNPLRDRFRREIAQISTSLKDRADAFARSYRPQDISLEPGEACDTRSSQNFIIDCKNGLQKQDQDQDLRLSASCRIDGQKRAPAPSYLSACADATFVGDSADIKPNLLARCTYPVEPPQQSLLQVPPQQLKPPDGRCPQGTRPIGRYRCVRVAGQPPPQIVHPPPPVRPPNPPSPPVPPPVGCSGDLVRTAQGGCTCPLGATLQGRDRCVLVSVPSPPPPVIRPPPFVPPIAPPPPTTSVRCAEGMVPTGDGRCRCPQGTVLRAGRCTRVSGPLPPPLTPPPPAPTTCPDGTRVPRGTPCPAPKPAGVRCPDGSHAQHFALCRMRCPGGSLVLQGQRCPVRPQPEPRPKAPCPPGYRTLPTPNKYGAYCELIPLPTPPRPKPETRRCPTGWIGHFPRCRRPASCGKGMQGTPPNCFPIVK